MKPEELQEVDDAAQALSKLKRASRGLPIDPATMIQKMVNVNNNDERSRLPTYPIVGRQVYLRLGALIFGEHGKILEDWADAIASSMIAYQGKQWDSVVEMTKRSNVQEGTTFNLGGTQQPPPPKRGFLRRGKREDTFNELDTE